MGKFFLMNLQRKRFNASFYGQKRSRHFWLVYDDGHDEEVSLMQRHIKWNVPRIWDIGHVICASSHL